MTRRIGTLDANAAAFEAAFDGLSFDCARGVDLLLEELEDRDPDPSERLGRLADRHEIYALRIPGCRARVLIVSLDTRPPPPWPCVAHAIVPAGPRRHDAARALAADHLDLALALWEPSP